MQNNNTNKWSEGLQFVQFMKNKAYHSKIKRSPYNAILGTDSMTSLSSSILTHTVLQEIPSTGNKKKQTKRRMTKCTNQIRNTNKKNEEFIKCLISRSKRRFHGSN